MESLFLKTSDQIKTFATPDCQLVLNELSTSKEFTAEDVSQRTDKPILDICYAIEKLEKYGFIKLFGGETSSGVLEKSYMRTSTDFCIKRVVGDYEEVEMQVSSPLLNKSEEAKRGCSFCGTSVEKVDKLIKGQREAHICDKCVTKCYKLLTKSS